MFKALYKYSTVGMFPSKPKRHVASL